MNTKTYEKEMCENIQKITSFIIFDIIQYFLEFVYTFFENYDKMLKTNKKGWQ